MVEEECVIVFPTDRSTDEAMTGGLGIEILACRKTNALTDSLASQAGNCDFVGELVNSAEERDMKTNSAFIIGRIGLISALFGAVGCAPAVVTSLPPTVRRVAVLPPYYRGLDNTTASTGGDLLPPVRLAVGDVLAQQARARLTEKGFDVIEPSIMKMATKNRVPTNTRMAAQILEEAHLDATALYIEVRRWEPTPNSRGMKADGVIIALDVTMVDPKTGTVLWQVRRPSRPVPLYGVVITGHANVFVAETVMREVFASLESKRPGG
jgi:hypothetical protein